jgi:hypothetical protein
MKFKLKKKNLKLKIQNLEKKNKKVVPKLSNNSCAYIIILEQKALMCFPMIE